MIVHCDNEKFCPNSTPLPPGELLADALRALGWQHKRLPMGKFGNYCPEHKR